MQLCSICMGPYLGVLVTSHRTYYMAAWTLWDKSLDNILQHFAHLQPGSNSFFCSWTSCVWARSFAAAALTSTIPRGSNEVPFWLWLIFCLGISICYPKRNYLRAFGSLHPWWNPSSTPGLEVYDWTFPSPPPSCRQIPQATRPDWPLWSYHQSGDL